MRLIITKQWKLSTVCTEHVRSPYIEYAASGLLNPTRLEGEVRFIQAQDQQVLPHNFLCVKIMEKLYGMRSQDVVDIIHLNCLAWQQSTSSGHPFFHPKPRNCPHQIDPFPTRNNPSNACLCVLPPALLSADRVSPLNETLLKSTHRQMKWRLAHCT